MDRFKLTRERKIILLFGAVILFAGLLYRYSPEIMGNFSSLSEEIELKKKKLFQSRKILEERNALESRLVSLNRALERGENRLLTGETPALAAVDIQNTLNKMAGKIEVQISSMRVLKPEKKEEDFYLTIPVQFTLQSNIRQLKEVVYEIEASSKILRIKEIRIRALRGKDKDQIQSTLTVEGFMREKKT
jgi:Tfp pilus assembly protein PilO